MGKKSKSKGPKKSKGRKKAANSGNDSAPPSEAGGAPDDAEQRLVSKLALTPEEEADLPELVVGGDGSDGAEEGQRDSLKDLGDKLGVTVIQRRHCVVCNLQVTEMNPHFTLNHWNKRDGFYGPRCKECVEAGEFPDSGVPGKRWVGWPKDPATVLWERGWIPPKQQGDRMVPDLTDYPPERLGKIVVALTDAELLLENFELAGHWGYGGLDEGLCCLPGCREADISKLKTCARCCKARYCCEDHQRCHYRFHKEECSSTAALRQPKRDGVGDGDAAASDE